MPPRADPRPDPISAGPAVELRVHGVSGTLPTAHDMLGRQDVEPVAGDRTAGFYRRAVAEPSSSGTVLEAYSWGNLTSGGASRALWLLLLPFMLVNVAVWMRPEPAAGARGRRLDAITESLVRLFGLSLTATITLAAIGVGVDLGGWQCAGPGRTCGARHTFLGFLSAGWWSQPGRRILATSAVPILLIGLLWYLGKRTWLAYESVRPPAGAGGAHAARLAEPGFWYGRAPVGRLRALHIAAAVATSGAVLAWPALQFDRTQPGTRAAWGWLAFGGSLVVLGSAAVATALPQPRPQTESAHANSPGRLVDLAEWIRFAGLAVAALSLGYLALTRPLWEARGALPGYEPTVRWLFVSQAVGLVVLAVALAVSRRGRPSAAPAMRGQATTVVAGLGLLLAAIFTAGITYRAADWLDGGRAPNSTPLTGTAGVAEPLTTPRPYAWASLAFLAIVLVVAGCTAWVWLRWLPRRAQDQVDSVRADYARRDDPGLSDATRVRQVARARAQAGATDFVGGWLGGLFVVGVVLAIPVFAAIIRIRTPAAALGLSAHPDVVRWLTNIANWSVGLLALGLISLGWQAYRSPQRRKVIGIVWDLGTFWPRAAHPLAPPCYAERSVPDLVCRIDYLDDDRAAEGLLVAAHSQGTVLAAAALVQLPAGGAQRTSLLTFGSPLRRLYGHYFPAYFGEDQLSCVLDAVRGRQWGNLYRPTDPIGGAVFADDDAVDRRLSFDPGALARQPGNPSHEPIHAHSNYQSDPEYSREVTRLLAQVSVPTPAPPTA